MKQKSACDLCIIIYVAQLTTMGTTHSHDNVDSERFVNSFDTLLESIFPEIFTFHCQKLFNSNSVNIKYLTVDVMRVHTLGNFIELTNVLCNCCVQNDMNKILPQNFENIDAVTIRDKLNNSYEVKKYVKHIAKKNNDVLLAGQCNKKIYCVPGSKYLKYVEYMCYDDYLGPILCSEVDVDFSPLCDQKITEHHIKKIIEMYESKKQELQTDMCNFDKSKYECMDTIEKCIITMKISLKYFEKNNCLNKNETDKFLHLISELDDKYKILKDLQNDFLQLENKYSSCKHEKCKYHEHSEHVEHSSFDCIQKRITNKIGACDLAYNIVSSCLKKMNIEKQLDEHVVLMDIVRQIDEPSVTAVAVTTVATVATIVVNDTNVVLIG